MISKCQGFRKHKCAQARIAYASVVPVVSLNKLVWPNTSHINLVRRSTAGG